MGISFSCPFATDNDLENGMESVTVKPISLGHEGNKTPRRSISFTGRDSDPVITKSLGSGKMMVEGSISFKQRQMETLVSINPLLSSGKEEGMLNRSFRCENMDIDNKLLTSDQIDQKVLPSFINDLASPKHEAALKLQKVYKSFRTRRKLADCAVLVEQSWWKLLDFAELKHSSISFFGIEHHETAISRWSRAKTRAAKVGRGLSQNDKAQKLALQHWLEAIDPRHRYGHNLHFYYVKWLQSQSREPFFYWLDIGEGKEVNLEKCPRLKLQQQCIKYLGPMERKAYEVVVEDGKFCYKQSGELLNTTSEAQAKWIFVLSTSKTLYVGMKMKGTFQHSSFLAGGATSAAGRLVVENGILKAVWPHSGHYRPTPENFQDFISYLRDNNVDLTYVKMDSVEEDDQSLNKQSSSIQLRNSSSSEEDSTMENAVDISTVDCVKERLHVAAQEQPSFRRSRVFSQTLTNLQIPKRDDLFVGIQSENSASGPTKNSNMCDEECEVKKEECIPEESILKRINSHKDAKSFQLGKQLSCKWTTGAGPRIGCVRDYPSELQVRALEQVNLSPRSGGPLKSLLSPCYASGSSPKATMLKTIMSQRSLKHIMAQSSPLSGRIRP